MNFYLVRVFSSSFVCYASKSKIAWSRFIFRRCKSCQPGIFPAQIRFIFKEFRFRKLWNYTMLPRLRSDNNFSRQRDRNWSRGYTSTTYIFYAASRNAIKTAPTVRSPWTGNWPKVVVCVRARSFFCRKNITTNKRSFFAFISHEFRFVLFFDDIICWSRCHKHNYNRRCRRYKIWLL